MTQPLNPSIQQDNSVIDLILSELIPARLQYDYYTPNLTGQIIQNKPNNNLIDTYSINIQREQNDIKLTDLQNSRQYTRDQYGKFIKTKPVQVKQTLICSRCKLVRQSLQTEFNLCATCVKIYNALQKHVERNNYQLSVFQVEYKSSIQLFAQITCHKGHTWQSLLSPRQGQKQCQQCSISNRQETKKNIIQQEQNQCNYYQQCQNVVFERAARFLDNIVQQPDHILFISNIINQLICDKNLSIQQNDLFQLVDSINYTQDEEVKILFNNIQTIHQSHVQRKFKFILHPDKNKHINATQAFQKWNNNTE